MRVPAELCSFCLQVHLGFQKCLRFALVTFVSACVINGNLTAAGLMVSTNLQTTFDAKWCISGGIIVKLRALSLSLSHKEASQKIDEVYSSGSRLG